MKTTLKIQHLAVAVLFSLALIHPRPAKAITIAAQLCTGADFLCNQAGDVIVDSGVRTNFVGLLGANTRSILPFLFTDALVTFNGTIVAADRAATFIYLWGTGTATANVAAAGLYFDIAVGQNYITQPGLWGFSEINRGTCNANASAAASTSLMQGIVNGGALPVIGAIGDCAIAPFGYGAGPFPFLGGGVTNMTETAQFFFAPGLYPQSITLPWGDDFPDPTLNFNDPNNPDNFITDTDVPAGFTDVSTPEPATFGLLGGALFGLGLFGRYRRRRSA